MVYSFGYSEHDVSCLDHHSQHHLSLYHRTRQNMPYCSNAVSCEYVFNCIGIWNRSFAIIIYTFLNDLKQIQYEDSLCVIRGYMSYVSCASHAYSYVLSTAYQYMIIVYPARVFWQSTRVQLLLIISAWILAFTYLVPFLFIGELVYNVNNQLCLAPLRLSFSMFYISSFIYVIPAGLVMVIYFKLVRYVKSMNERTTLAATASRVQRDFAVVRRIVILLHVILIAGVPMTAFVFLSFVNLEPKYYFRIGFFFLYVSMMLAIIILFKFTDPLKSYAKKIITIRRHAVLPIVTMKISVMEKKNITISK